MAVIENEQSVNEEAGKELPTGEISKAAVQKGNGACIAEADEGQIEVAKQAEPGSASSLGEDHTASKDEQNDVALKEDNIESEKAESLTAEASDALKALKKSQERRFHIVSELIATEQSYVDKLKLVAEIFYEPLTKKTSQQLSEEIHSGVSNCSVTSTGSAQSDITDSTPACSTEEGEGETSTTNTANAGPLPSMPHSSSCVSLSSFVVGNSLISAEDAKAIFINWPTLIDINTEFLDTLQERKKSWSDSQCIGDIFIDFASKFKKYTLYVNFYNKGKEVLKKLEKSNSLFREFIRYCKMNPRCGRQSLADFLILPVQRIPRCLLLIQELYEHTPKDHPDHANLSNARSILKEICNYINEHKRAVDRQFELFEIVNDIENCPPIVLSSSRILIFKLDLQRLGTDSESVRQNVTFFLFNDSIEVAKKRTGSIKRSGRSSGKKWKHLTFSPFKTIQLIDINDTEEYKNLFSIAFSDCGCQIFQFTSSEDKDLFIKKIQSLLPPMAGSSDPIDSSARPVKANDFKAPFPPGLNGHPSTAGSGKGRFAMTWGKSRKMLSSTKNALMGKVRSKSFQEDSQEGGASEAIRRQSDDSGDAKKKEVSVQRTSTLSRWHSFRSKKKSRPVADPSFFTKPDSKKSSMLKSQSTQDLSKLVEGCATKTEENPSHTSPEPQDKIDVNKAEFKTPLGPITRKGSGLGSMGLPKTPSSSFGSNSDVKQILEAVRSEIYRRPSAKFIKVSETNLRGDRVASYPAVNSPRLSEKDIHKIIKDVSRRKDERRATKSKSICALSSPPLVEKATADSKSPITVRRALSEKRSSSCQTSFTDVPERNTKPSPAEKSNSANNDAGEQAKPVAQDKRENNSGESLHDLFSTFGNLKSEVEAISKQLAALLESDYAAHQENNPANANSEKNNSSPTEKSLIEKKPLLEVLAMLRQTEKTFDSIETRLAAT
eukprot:Nk52_evm21s675 gene=Nk52_evmTU21s675